MQVVIPILLVVGVSNNVLVLAGFSQPSVSRSILRRLGVFYRLIAAFDIWVLLTKDFAAYWLEDGLSLTSGGRVSLTTRTHSSFWYTVYCVVRAVFRCIVFLCAAPKSFLILHNSNSQQV